MLAWLEARAWQVGTFAAGAAALVLAGTLAVTVIQKNAVTRDRDRLFTAIEAPKTGWRDRMAVCSSNVGNLEGAIGERNRKIEQLGLDAAKDLAVAEQQVAAARSVTAALNTRLNRLQSAPAAGATVCERIEVIDRAVLESLK